MEAVPETTASAGFTGADDCAACLPCVCDCAAYLREPFACGRCDPVEEAAGADAAAAGMPEDGASETAVTVSASRPASRRAANSSNRMRGEIAPFILASVALIVSAICVSAANPNAEA